MLPNLYREKNKWEKWKKRRLRRDSKNSLRMTQDGKHTEASDSCLVFWVKK